MLSRFVLALVLAVTSVAASGFTVGSGIADITGPPVELGFMGYAMENQIGSGIHTRLFARAFIIEQPVTAAGGPTMALDGDAAGGAGVSRVIYVSTDACMIMAAVRHEVVKRVLGKYGSTYSADGILLHSTHTHSGPGGFSWSLLYDMTTFGFSKENFEAVVSGIVSAIDKAHKDLQPGSIVMAEGELTDANRNRSPTSYLANPASERAQYAQDTDNTTVVLRLNGANAYTAPVGMINFFAVHGTSMNNTNTLISSDNKGHASYLVEMAINGATSRPGNGSFVAAFAQSNEGDVSPNTRGAFCPDGSRCDAATSTCNGRSETCIALGPGETDFESTRIIGERQAQAALDLFNSASQSVEGPVGAVYAHVDMSNVVIQPAFASSGVSNATTCTAAMGYSFAAGTTDGPGEFDFTQGQTSGNPFWNAVSSLISDPTDEEKQCQHPKPILLNVGRMKEPADADKYQWIPHIMPLQILRVGNFFIIGAPGEFTTMAGRRLRKTVRKALVDNGVSEDGLTVVIAGLANTYAGYIATFEEYSKQRYEAASTVFGPHSLEAYQQEFARLAAALATGASVDPGPTPKDRMDSTFSLLPPVIVDGHPADSPFGTVTTQPAASTTPGQTVEAVFQSANPRNYLAESYCNIEVQNGSSWSVYRTDADWETKFHWKRHGIDQSLVTCEWNIDASTPAGTYRIKHYGHSKDVLKDIKPFSGTSNNIAVASAARKAAAIPAM